MSVPFGTRLGRVFRDSGRLCVGIDPHPYLLSSWGMDDSARAAQQFGMQVVEATVGSAGIVKPQVAFFERFGAHGYAALEAVIAAAREAGLLVIADAKRGDVGSTLDAYARAWLTPSSTLEADALTVSAFQGVGSLSAAVSLAHEAGKGLFVLAATSNPESVATQRAIVDTQSGQPRSLSRVIIDDVTRINQVAAESAIGSIGVVLGATLELTEYGIDLATAPVPALPVLAPGFGAQGAALADAPHRYGALMAAAIISESRSLLSAGPHGLVDAIASRAQEVQAVCG